MHVGGVNDLGSSMDAEQSVFDLGIDSLRLVDLTLALEDEFALPKLDMLGWIERERAASGRKGTVRSLAEACRLATGDRGNGQSAKR